MYNRCTRELWRLLTRITINKLDKLHFLVSRHYVTQVYQKKHFQIGIVLQKDLMAFFAHPIDFASFIVVGALFHTREASPIHFVNKNSLRKR